MPRNCILTDICLTCWQVVFSCLLKPDFHYTANGTTTTQKQSDYKVEQSPFILIALFCLEIGLCRGRNWLNGTRLNENSTFVVTH